MSKKRIARLGKGLAILWLALGVLPNSLQAVENRLHSARCGTDLVKLGDSRATLLAHCGRPLESLSVGRGAREYHFRQERSGPTTIFRIRDGRVIEIRQIRRL
ncbi:DUF2845 domain-containing protein [Ferrimonas gelatinilytica]|uniref:DUF2845 domain-containing protein n=1 Tax=Ferrimonas gelatinilytica TaxID=1255257 RepID=A0ABP9SDC7_9GAMM